MASYRQEIKPHSGLDNTEIGNRLHEWAKISSSRGWKISESSAKHVVLSRKSRKGLMCMPFLFIAIFIYYTGMYGLFAGLITLPIYGACALCGWGITKSVIIHASIQQREPTSIVVNVERPENAATELVDILVRMFSETGSSLV